MKTKEELAVIIARQTKENNPSMVIIRDTFYDEKEQATRALFDYVNNDGEILFDFLNAVVYDDETCFTPRDWFNDHEEETVWFDHEHCKEGIVLNGLPRVF